MLEKLTTEARNPNSEALDSLSSLALVQLMNSEDAKVAVAVAAEEKNIAAAIEKIAISMLDGGRLIYMGAGTSGRLGVLDAVECIPTFNAKEGQIIGLMAGGAKGMMRAVEGAEDSDTMGRDDLEALNLKAKDVVVGIAASGRTPYVIGGLDYAETVGAYRIAFSCNANAEIQHHADLSILTVVGPEVLSGSTRLKSGTATKMVLNMLTTGAMVLMGKTYGNLMVDMLATNGKLVARACGMIEQITAVSNSEAEALLTAADGQLKIAITMGKLSCSADEAVRLIAKHNGRLRHALEDKT